MADRSEHGWATVEEYLEDELAENSDDEKRMQKAEYRAGRKLKAAAAKTGKKKSMGSLSMSLVCWGELLSPLVMQLVSCLCQQALYL